MQICSTRVHLTFILFAILFLTSFSNYHQFQRPPLPNELDTNVCFKSTREGDILNQEHCFEDATAKDSSSNYDSLIGSSSNDSTLNNYPFNNKLSFGKLSHCKLSFPRAIWCIVYTHFHMQFYTHLVNCRIRPTVSVRRCRRGQASTNQEEPQSGSAPPPAQGPEQPPATQMSSLSMEEDTPTPSTSSGPSA